MDSQCCAVHKILRHNFLSDPRPFQSISEKKQELKCKKKNSISLYKSRKKFKELFVSFVWMSCRPLIKIRLQIRAILNQAWDVLKVPSFRGGLFQCKMCMTDTSKKREGNKDSRENKRFKRLAYFDVNLKVNTADKQKRF